MDLFFTCAPIQGTHINKHDKIQLHFKMCMPFCVFIIYSNRIDEIESFESNREYFVLLQP